MVAGFIGVVGVTVLDSGLRRNDGWGVGMTVGAAGTAGDLNRIRGGAGQV